MGRFLRIGFLVCLYFQSVKPACPEGKNRCEWISWKQWSSCDSSCGGGRRYRSRPICCKADLDFDTCMRDCGLSSSASSDYGDCNTVCYNNGSYYGGSCHCRPEWDGNCCSNPKCCYNNHWCWPGNCGYNDLAYNCRCDSGFQKDASRLFSKCQLASSNSPDLITCRMGITSKDGDAKNSTSGNPNDCMHESFTYFSFQPATIHFTMEAVFKVTIYSPKPFHIEDYSFGVVQNSISLNKRTVTGQLIVSGSIPIMDKLPTCTTSFSDDNPATGVVTCTSEVYTPTVQNGERLCIQFTSFGGGFLRTKDFHNSISAKQIYKRTQSTREVCFRYDNAPPIHCSIETSCHDEPLNVYRRITTEPSVDIHFPGWIDSSPTPSQPDQASGIEKYSLSLFGVQELDRQTLVMKGKLNYNTIPAQSTRFNLNLPHEPALYALLLEVHDLAGNVKAARRFVLFDKSSSVQINNGRILRVTSASEKTNYTWQVNHGSICLDWKGRYYNSYYRDNNLLKQIKYDASVSSEYDQVHGPLSISGTPNVDGIVEFQYQMELSGTVQPLTFKKVNNVEDESLCETLKISDGETYTFIIKPFDINNRSITENITVHIDSTKPEIDNIWLAKDGYKQRFVHHSSDLSEMVLEFEAMDTHSGLASIEWKFGTSSGSDDIRSGTISVNRSPNETLCTTQYCYCPNVGMCENYFYTVSLNKLDLKEMKNANYFLSIIVTNNAHLICVGSIVIFTDETPPMAGIIQDGTSSVLDIDFTSDDEVFVHWDGFIDDESGIKFYKVAVASRCLQRSEFDVKKVFGIFVLVGIKEVLENNVSFTIRCPGRYFSSVVAYNNALQPSEVVCSDGFTSNYSESNLTPANDTLRNKDCPHESGTDGRLDILPIGLIIGLVVAVTMILIMGVVVAFFVLRRRNFPDNIYDDVQTENQQEVQYSTIEDVKHIVNSEAGTNVFPRGKFIQWYNSLLLADPKSGKSRLYLQFEEYIARMAKRPLNRAYENISFKSDYSGANIGTDSVTRYHIDGKGRICLTTSISMTTSSFWKCVIDSNIGSIISVRDTLVRDVDMNENINIQLRDYRVEEKTDKMISGIPYVKLQITHSENFQCKRSVHHVILHLRNEEGQQMTDVKNLVTIYIHYVRSIYGSENQNILLHTNHPNDGCGILCSLFSVLQHMDETDKFDLDNSLKHNQDTNGSNLDTFEKYKFLYDVGSQYIQGCSYD